MMLCIIRRRARIMTLRVVMFIIAQIVHGWIFPKPNVLAGIRVDIVAAKNKKVIFLLFKHNCDFPMIAAYELIECGGGGDFISGIGQYFCIATQSYRIARNINYFLYI